MKCVNCKTELSKTGDDSVIFNTRDVNLFLDKEILSVEQVLHFNFKANPTSGPEKLCSCISCAVPLFNLHNSKQKFLKMTQAKSKIWLINNNNSSKADDHLLSDEKSKSAEDHQEKILPDADEEDVSTNNRRSIIKPASNFKELFPELSIKKLCGNKGEINRLEENFKCLDCGRQFLSSNSLESHRNAAHKKLEIFSCDLCTNKFSQEWFLKYHIRKFHTGIKIAFLCLICKEKFPTKESSEEHKLEKHDIRKFSFKCNNCKESYNEISELRIHLISKHEDSVEAKAAVSNMKTMELSRKCSVCENAFETILDLKKHLKSEHGVIACACNLKFSREKERKKHFNSCQKCPECTRIFKGCEKLQEHQRTAHGKLDYDLRCEICGLIAKTISQLSGHYKRHEESSGPRCFCNICNKSFKYKTSLELHLKSGVHLAGGHRVRKFKCDHCSQTFVHKTDLSLHLTSAHEIEMRLSCKVCAKEFLWAESLNAHLRTHTMESTFKKIEVAKRKEALSKVEVTSCFSSQLQKFTCPLCDKEIEHKFHFIRHLNSHNLKFYTEASAEKNLPKVVKCKNLECDRRYSRIDLMNKHYRKSHNPNSKQFVNPKVSCTICDMQVNPMLLQPHLVRHKTRITITTPEGEVIKDLNEFYHNKEPNRSLLICSICQQEFPCQLQNDFIKHHISAHKSKVLNSKDDDDDSKVDDDEWKGDTCFQCNKTFKTNRILNKHRHNVHKRFDKWVSCHLCQRNFKSNYELRRHLEAHKKRETKAKSS